MRKTPLARRAALALALAAVPVRAFASRPADAPVTAFRIRRQDRYFPDSLLFPSAHGEGYPFRPPSAAAFHGRGRLLLETVHDGADRAALSRADSEWSPADHFTPEEISLLRAALRCEGVVVELEWVRPFIVFVATGCGGLPNIGSAFPAPGASRYPARDLWLRATAMAMRIPVCGIETPAETRAASARIPDGLVIRLIQRALRAHRSPDLVAHHERGWAAVQDAAEREDFDELRDRALDVLGGDGEARPHVERHLIDDRNKVFAARLAALMRSESIVAAIGAAHIGGPTGVPTLLAGHGLRVERMLVPAHAG